MVVVELQNMEEMFAPLAAYISKLGALAPTVLAWDYFFCTRCLHDPPYNVLFMIIVFLY